MRKLLSVILIFWMALPLMAAKSYTVVLDPGHGGKDPGAVGRFSQEKDLNLSLALEVGKLITKQYPDVKVVYTRSTDVFIPLQKRADIANKNNADLFISIHTNSAESKEPSGVETFILGTERMEANAEKIGLGDDIYLATYHRNGVLRLVAIEGEDLNMANYVKVGKTYWMKTNLGASNPRQSGSVVTYEDAVKYCPAGHRLPSKEEYEELLALGGARFSNISGNSNAELYFPARDVATFYMNETWRESGDYFIQGNSYSLYFGQYRDAGYLTQNKPEISRGSLSKGLVRYVLDK